MHFALASLRHRSRKVLGLLLLWGGMNPNEGSSQDSLAEASSWIRPLVMIGPSLGFRDAGDARGLGTRLGLRLPALDLSLVGDYWNHWAGFHIYSSHLEANYYPIGAGTIAPYVLVGLGAVRWEDVTKLQGIKSDWSSSAGLGLHVMLPARSAIRAEALLRADAGAYIGEIRLGMGFSAKSPPLKENLPPAERELVLAWMTPVNGPWQFVDPGFGVHFSQPVSGDFAGTLGVEIYHWQIPASAPGGYLWDTRAIVSTLGLEWRPEFNDWFSIRTGPAIVAMGEGPDAGANLGLHGSARVRAPLNRPVGFGVGMLWFPRDPDSDARITANEGQLGLTLFGSLRM